MIGKWVSCVLGVMTLATSAMAGTGVTITGDDPGPDVNLRCSCEHFESPYDGICEVTVSGYVVDTYSQYTKTYEWQAFGAAWMPYPAGPYDEGAYYTIASAGDGGGLDVIVTITRLDKMLIIDPNGVPTPWGIWQYGPYRCRIGTVGAG